MLTVIQEIGVDVHLPVQQTFIDNTGLTDVL